MNGKFCVITGATSGIGQAAALALGAMGADLVLLGRNESRGNSTVARITRLAQFGTVEFLRTDLAEPAEVRQTAAVITGRGRPVDVLINNAGARYDHFKTNAAGHELTFAANHLGHFLLTGLLLEKIMEADHGRVITVSSGSHGGARSDGPWEFEAGNYDRRQAYAKSKLANILFAYELARRLDGSRAVSCAVDPGGVASNFARNNGLVSWGKHLLSHALRRELVSPHNAAQALVRLASARGALIANGGYYHGLQPARSSPASHDLGFSRKLWALSLALTDTEKIQGRYAG